MASLVLGFANQWPVQAESGQRVTGGLQVLYTFDSGSGNTVRDRSGVKPALDLKIETPSAVEWKDGTLVIQSPAAIKSRQPAEKIISAVKRSKEITIEAWLLPANRRQKGPARIVSLSGDPSHRNFTLGQQEDTYDVRLRTSKTSRNGLPSIATPSHIARPRLTHLVYTRNAAGDTSYFLNGGLFMKKKVAGNMSNWKGGFHLLLADEAGGGRAWLGEYHLVAVYSRALTKQEVKQNHRAGAGAGSKPMLSAEQKKEQFFNKKIAALLARRCLDCHDAASKKGGLDLSHKATAFAGGESGKVIVPGNAADSLLFDQIESGDMPPDGAPLSSKQKESLKRWINDGAVWTAEVIDPAVYAQDDRGDAIWIQRLTVAEYIETVRSAVGVDISKEARQILPPDVRADGFSNTSYNLNVDLKHVEAYARLAELIVSRMDVLKFAKRFTRTRRLTNDKKMRAFVSAMGTWLLRGPLNDREITNYCGVATSVAAAGGNFKEVTGYLIQTMLQSPRFIYRMEDQTAVGQAERLDDYELAVRMSYILWGAPPDRELMRAAGASELNHPHAALKQVRRMLGDPRTVERSRHFLAEWLHLDRLDNLQPNSQRFPHWTAELGADMRRETLDYFEDVVWKQKRPLSDLFNAQLTYASPRLAAHYGLDAKESAWERYDLSAVPSRGGLLTQGSVLTVGGDDASMVTRGLFVLQDILRGAVKDPPPGLDTTPVPPKPGQSQRNVSEQRIANAACAGCHSRFEPLAFGLEKFDGLGAFHEKDEHGNQLRDDGEILFPNTANPAKYQTSAELMDLLAGSERVRETLTWKVTQFALGRPLTATDAPLVSRIHQESQKQGGTYTGLMTAILMSDLVRMKRAEPAPLESE